MNVSTHLHSFRELAHAAPDSPPSVRPPPTSESFGRSPRAPPSDSAPYGEELAAAEATSRAPRCTRGIGGHLRSAHLPGQAGCRDSASGGGGRAAATCLVPTRARADGAGAWQGTASGGAGRPGAAETAVRAREEGGLGSRAEPRRRISSRARPPRSVLFLEP